MRPFGAGSLSGLRAKAITTNYNFVHLASVPQMEMDKEIDVAGWVKDTGKKMVFTRRVKEG